MQVDTTDIPRGWPIPVICNRFEIAVACNAGSYSASITIVSARDAGSYSVSTTIVSALGAGFY